MRKFWRKCICFIMIGCALLTCVGCSSEEEENAEPSVQVEETEVSAPVEYGKDTAQGILTTAYQKLLTSDKVSMTRSGHSFEDGEYVFNVEEETIVCKNGNRYAYGRVGERKSVVGKYGDDWYELDVNAKTATIYDREGYCDGFTIMAEFLTDVKSGVCIDGIMYIHIALGNETRQSYCEVKIVDGYIMEGNVLYVSDDCAVYSYTYTFTYGSLVDDSVIPKNLDGYTVV